MRFAEPMADYEEKAEAKCKELGDKCIGLDKTFNAAEVRATSGLVAKDRGPPVTKHAVDCPRRPATLLYDADKQVTQAGIEEYKKQALLTITGTNFGASGAIVLIGGLRCSYNADGTVEHAKGKEHSELHCWLPPAQYKQSKHSSRAVVIQGGSCALWFR